jgi:hypothetical protein
MRRLGHQRGALAAKRSAIWADDRPDAAAGPASAGRTARRTLVSSRPRRRAPAGRRGGRFGARSIQTTAEAGLPVAVGQRHQREGPAGAVDLGRDIAMRQGMGDGEGQRLLPVAEGARTDPQRLRAPANCARRRRQQPRAKPGAVAQGDQRLGSRVSSRAKPTPGRKLDARQLASRATISRRRSQLGRFQPKGCVGNVGGVEIMGDARFGLRAAGIDDAHHLQAAWHGARAGPTVPPPAAPEARVAGRRWCAGRRPGAPPRSPAARDRRISTE